MSDAKKKKDKPPKRKLSKQEKKTRYLRIFYVTVFFGTIIVWKGLQPFDATINYGICRTFVEMQLRFPQTLVISALEESERTQRLYYTYTGSSGEQRSSMIECKFATNPNNGNLYIQSIEVDRVPVERDKVKEFNRLIPVVIASDPDLVAPDDLNEKDLQQLKTEYQYHDWEDKKD